MVPFASIWSFFDPSSGSIWSHLVPFGPFWFHFLFAVIKLQFSFYRSTQLPQVEKSSLQELEIEQLTSVIHGLLRQNSYTFLEVLEEASISAIKTAFRDVAKQILAPDDPDVTLTNLVADLAKKANGQRWVEFFDILLGE